MQINLLHSIWAYSLSLSLPAETFKLFDQHDIQTKKKRKIAKRPNWHFDFGGDTLCAMLKNCVIIRVFANRNRKLCNAISKVLLFQLCTFESMKRAQPTKQHFYTMHLQQGLMVFNCFFFFFSCNFFQVLSYTKHLKKQQSEKVNDGGERIFNKCYIR